MPHAQRSQRHESSRRGSTRAAGAAAIHIRPTVPHRALVQTLATRFQGDLDAPEIPLVTINRTSTTRSIHILVIWNKWKDLPIPARGRVITDAFAAAFPNDDAAVRLPMGLTAGEAFSQGYLRYRITPSLRATDHVTSKQVRDAMYSAGGIVVEVGDEVELRFATRAQAEGAYRQLLEDINKPIWTLSEETRSTDSGG
jgi:hypothetical protein